jgi:hypothetical protein
LTLQIGEPPSFSFLAKERLMQRSVPVTVLASASIAIATLGWVATSHHDSARASSSTPIVASPAASIVAAAPTAPAPVVTRAHAHHAPANMPVRTTEAPVAPVAATEVWTPLPSAAPGEAGMRAFYDPETGTIGGPVQLNSQVESQAPENWQDLLIETRAADGSPMIDLKGYMQEYMMLHISLDGRRTMKCVEDPKKAIQDFAVPSAQSAEK